MKFLFQIRPDYLQNPAGDTVQIVSTGRALKALGVDVAPCSLPAIRKTRMAFVGQEKVECSYFHPLGHDKSGSSFSSFF